MKVKYSVLSLVVASVLLAGCQSTAPSRTRTVEAKTNASGHEVAKSAYEFTDADIELPAYYSTQGLEHCTFDVEDESPACPLRKKIIRVYFGTPDTQGKNDNNDWLATIRSFDQRQLLHTFENQIAGVNRFRIVTQDDDTLTAELQKQKDEQSAANIARRAEQGVLQPDYVMKIDTLKTGELVFGGSKNYVEFGLQFTNGFINPYTKEKISYPNIGKITVKNADVRNANEMLFHMRSGRFESGFNFYDPNSVGTVLNEMSSRGFDIMISRLLSEMPATAQVQGIKGNRISLDRGQNAGILPDETMVLFEYSAGFAEPIGVASVNPSLNSASGQIIRWKDSNDADRIKQQADDGIYRPQRDARIFAVSVGTPASFLENRI